ncbi:non-ribosomal peptide synthetase [Bacillus wiedmannii]|uniref:non-ribosomal peptide synthetase n=1 Tax=Bacillus wiedmannii TaxID=1890302 RepID=UPI0009B55340|nr:non-ribosomal peptide synthetase [Bacillus wiedmannii]
MIDVKKLEKKNIDVKKLEKKNIEDIYPLSPLQEGMLFHYLDKPDSKLYYEQLVLTLVGDIDSNLFGKAWQLVTKSNEILRTIYRWDKLATPLQIVLKEHPLPITEHDLASEADEERKHHSLEQIKMSDKIRHIDISSEPYRITLCKLETGLYQMFLTNHHILLDGWSNGILLKEFFQTYNALHDGQEPRVIVKNKYKKFLEWNRQQDQSEQKDFWGRYLKGFDTKTLLPISSKMDKNISKPSRYSITLSAETNRQMQKAVRELKTTTATILYTAWGILLQRYNNTLDAVFGTTISGRNARVEGLDNMVGLFINTPPLRVKTERNERVYDLVKKVEAGIREREFYENTPLVDIKSYSEVEAQGSLFDSILVIENYPLEKQLMEGKSGLKVIDYSIFEQTNFDLTVEIELFDDIQIRFTYIEGLFDAVVVQRMAKHFLNILEAMIGNYDLLISEIDILTEDEERQIKIEFNDTTVEYPKSATIHELFEYQVEKMPEHIAAMCGDDKLTYRELNERSNQLARILRSKGVGRDTIVALIAERSLSMITAIMAIIKAGGAYLPIDPKIPKDRIQFILEDSGADLLLTQKHLIDHYSFDVQMIDVDESALYEGDSSNLHPIGTSEDLAYVIYTSGSTGKPKGAMIAHYSLVNRINWMQKEYPIHESDVIMQKTPCTFDVSVWEMFWWAITGATVCFLEPEGEKDPRTIVECINKYDVSTMHFVPSMLNIFLDYIEDMDGLAKLESLKKVFCSGEALLAKQAEKFNKLFYETTQARLINLYGPTEAAIDVSYFNCSTGDKLDIIPIGKPIDNIQLYIVDNVGKLQPIGVAGELCIAGEGLARGYLNRSELTTEKFVSNPFTRGTKMYRTGDLARWMADGNIEYLGRLDHQVKIRGVRIELGEIEKQLVDHPDVKEAAVIVKKDDSESSYLCAYVTVGEVSIRELKKFLAKRLPSHSIPSFFVRMEKLPLSPNGKLDRKELPEPDLVTSMSVEYVEPSAELEKELAAIWQQVLGVKPIGIDHDFFELGGHSLRAMTVASKIHKELEVPVTVSLIFENPTIRELAKAIENADTNKYIALQPVEIRETYPVSSAQKRLYILSQMEESNTNYNMSGAVLIEGELNRERFETTLQRLIQRHEGLRTSFDNKKGEIVQRVHDKADIKLGISQAEEHEIPELMKQFVRPFDLSQAPLLRCQLVATAQNKHVLLFDMHHIISDGVSLSIFTQDFIDLYEGKDLPELEIQYKDFSIWQNTIQESEVMKSQERYWLDTFAGDVPVLDLPIDEARPHVQSFEGDNFTFELDAEDSKALYELANGTGTTLYMVLLAAYHLLLSKYSGQQDIVIGSPIAGRHHADTMRTMGMFVNTLAMRNNALDELTFGQFLQNVKHNSLKAFENQDYPFELLVEKKVKTRDASRNPLFDIMFVLQNIETTSVQFGDLAFQTYEFDAQISKFDMTLSAREEKGRIYFTLEYCTKLFRSDTVERMATHFLYLLRKVPTNLNSKLAEISLMSANEIRQVLHGFNNTTSEYPREKTLGELFDEQVEQHPDGTAVVFGENRLTYKELNDKANIIGEVLRKHGVGAQSIVAIMAERSLEMVIGILGIIKAGGAYLPIDPVYPQQRMQYMLEDSGCKMLLVSGDPPAGIDFSGECLDISLQHRNLWETKASQITTINKPSDLAYIIYTSGSTGKPKGTMIEQLGVIRLVKDTNYVTFEAGDKILQTGSVVFDASTFEIWGALLNGLQLCLVNEDIILDAAKLHKAILDMGISMMWLTAPLFNQLSAVRPEMFETLKYLLVGGDVLSPVHINAVRNRCKDLTIINGYGPTENTTFTVCFPINKEYTNAIPIGKPISNTSVYILDKNHQPCPVGVPGELFIGGDGLARGYLNNPELTAEKFVDVPAELYGELAIDQKLYRSGDRARWLSDGNIEFLGRIDNQVKIRGFRIEISEIETRIMKYAGVTSVVVVPKGDDHNKYLCAYLTADTELNQEEMRKFLLMYLPNYMVPSYFIKLDRLPLKISGKIDVDELTEIEGSIDIGYSYKGPSNDIEEKLIPMWEELLGITGIGVTHNFFELGGHSLKAAVLMAELHKEFEVEVPLRELFKGPTIEELATYIIHSGKQQYAPIELQEESEYYIASAGQTRLYVLSQFEGIGTSYNIPAAFIVEGKLDLSKVDLALQQLVKRHELLRTSFDMVDGKVVQIVHEKAEFTLSHFEVEEHNIDNAIKNFIQYFDLQKAPLLRVGIAKLDETRHLLLFDMHHIISDGTTMGILIDEFVQLYEGKGLPPISVQYKDFSQWQYKLFEKEVLKQQERYWLDSFAGEIPVLNLPLDYLRPAVQSFEGKRLVFELDKVLTDKLNILARKTGTTLYMVLLASYNILLQKYTGQQDIVVGSPIAGRSHADLKKMIGMFVNTLAMRNRPDDAKTFSSFLREVEENTIEAFENSDYQFEQLVEKLHINRDKERNPLFDTMFVLQNTDERRLELEGLRFESVKLDNQAVKFDITLNAEERGGGIQFLLEYRTKLFKDVTMERFASHFIYVLEQIVHNPDLKLAEIELLSVGEKEQTLFGYNSTTSEYPMDKTIQELFEQQVEKTPERIAVEYGTECLTYQELNERSNQLARVLRDKGVGRDVVVALIAERSIEMVTAMIAIVKAGGAYLPIDPDYPQERIQYMFEDSGSRIVLTEKPLIERFAELDADLIDLNDSTLYEGDSSNLKKIGSTQDLAYIIYTSGSTGKPKGVMIEQRNLVHYIWWAKKTYLDENEVFALYSSISFDLTVTSIFTPLISGNQIVIYSGDGKEFILDTVLKENKATIVKLTPAHLTLIKDRDNRHSSVKKMIVGGDNLKVTVAKEVINSFHKEMEIYNEYGPTEATVGCMTYKYATEKDNGVSVPIGVPIDNTQIYILDKYLKPVATNLQGEIYISGDGVARGYLNQSELTNERFINNPFINGAKMYKTGDIAKYLPGGNIEYIGRNDDQVKIRGHRIEMGEIERKLAGHEAVKEAVVTARDGKSSMHLCAYVTVCSEVTFKELRMHLLKELPEYMVPSYFVQLEEIPLSPNGKIDLKALPEPSGDSHTETEYIPPSTLLEEQLVEIWKEVIGLGNEIGIQDNFFEIGGHSLSGAAFVSKVHKHLNVDLPLSELFNSPTIKQLADYIESKERTSYTSIKPAEPREYYPVSSAQKRLYIICQFESIDTSYNMPLAMSLKGKINMDRLGEAVKKLTQRHEVLRTAFEMVEDQIVQRIYSGVDVVISHLPGTGRDISEIKREFVRPFDLSKAPLFRVGLAKIAENEHVLLMDMHHIIADGLSMNILIQEFSAFYQGKELPEPGIQYKDFAVWQNGELQKEVLREQEDYWLGVLADEIPVLELQTEGTRPGVQSFKGTRLDFELDSSLSSHLKKMSTGNGTTLHMLMLSAFYVLLYKYTGQEDIVIGTPVAGRHHDDLKETIGMFVNMLPLRNQPSGEKTFMQFLQEVKQNTLSAYDNQNYQFDDLVEKLNLHRDLSRNPLFDVVFSLHNNSQNINHMGDLNLEFYQLESNTAKYDLSMDVLERSDKISFSLEYCTDLFSKLTIENLSSHYVNILNEVVQSPEVKIKDLEVLSEAEKNRVLHEFNSTEMTYERNQIIHALVEKRASITPDEIALVFQDEKMSYGELNGRANQLAHRLREYGISRNKIVGVMAERSIDIVVAILGVLKAGGAYLPIDPDYPEERIKYMLKDSEAKLLLTYGHLADRANFDGPVIDIDDKAHYTGGVHNPAHINEATDLSYIMYTSGSTGNPKGVMLTHRGVINISGYYNEMFDFELHKHIVHMANVSFDASIVEIFPPLIYGVTIFILGKEQALDRREFIKFVKDKQIQIAQFVPVTLKELLSYNEKPENLDIILVAGDKLDDTLKDDILSKGYQLTNHYGPTEGTVDSIVAKCDSFTTTIGKPIANTRVYILDKDDNLAPIGVPGELCIAGDGLARGYLNNPTLTSEKFVPDPFQFGEKMYRTGDLGCWKHDGNIKFLGRKDNQIKLRGYRVELGEIEEHLLKMDEIREAVVIGRTDKTGSKYLCAYIISEQELNLQKIKQYLSQKLPDYMIPARFMRIDKVHLTSSGKVNRRALPEPDNILDSEIEYVAPTNETEKDLVQMWEQILDVTGIGINHNFFDLGGHSLKATILVSKIHREMDVVVPLANIFSNPTISELAQYILGAEHSQHIAIQPVEEMPYYPVSSAQKRTYIMWKMNEQSTAYNMPSAMMLEGEIDKVKFEDAVKKLVARHEILRSSFELIEGEPVQIVKAYAEPDIQFLGAKEEELKELALRFVKPFDLTVAPVFRAALITIEQDKHLMLFDVHHIASDGISLSIMLKDFANFYGGEQLIQPSLHYKDYAVWHNALLQSEEIQKSRQYWIDSLKDFAYTELPVVRNSFGQRQEGIVKQVLLDSQWTEAINNYCKKHSITSSVLVMGAFQMALLRVLDRSELTVGVSAAGRRREEVEDMPGMFLNVLLVSSNLNHCPTFIDYLYQLRDRLAQGQEHQDYPYECIYADAKEVLNFRPESLFTILFNYLPFKDNKTWEFKGFNVQPYAFEQIEPKYGLTLYVEEQEDSITLDYLFNSNIDESMMINLVNGFKTVLEIVLENDSVSIGQIALQSKEVSNTFLEDFDAEFDNDDFV